MQLSSAVCPTLLVRIERLLRCANQNAALVIEALCSRSAVLADGVHQARPNAGQVEVAEEIHRLLGPSQLAQLAPRQVPRFVIDRSVPHALGAELDFDPRVSLFRGDHRLSPDRYSVHCTPQIHGALLDQLRRAWQSVAPESVEYHEATASPERHLANGASPALHRHQLPSACGVANLKAAIAALSSISERRLAKLLDPVRNHGLPASLVPNPDGNHYGLMVLRYRAAVLVGEISERAMPAGSSPTACRGKAHANSTLETTEPTSIDALCQALQSVLALERYAAVQALRVRMELFARVHGARLAPTPGEFALRVIEQFEGAGLTTVWDGRKLRDEIERVRGMLGV